MRITRSQKSIGVLLIMICLLSGICVGGREAYSFVKCAQKESVQGISASVDSLFCSNLYRTEPQVLQDVCELESNSGCTYEKNHESIVIFISYLTLLTGSSVLLQRFGGACGPFENDSSSVIITYVHSQDGSKSA